ncbi:hypothetical protein VTO73DRAFT_10450 [Trametes versicolor]
MDVLWNHPITHELESSDVIGHIGHYNLFDIPSSNAPCQNYYRPSARRTGLRDDAIRSPSVNAKTVPKFHGETHRSFLWL